MIAPRTEEHLEYFEEDKEIACYDSNDELREKAIYYIDHDQERVKMARLAHSKVLSRHTYIHRMQKLIDCLELNIQ